MAIERLEQIVASAVQAVGCELYALFISGKHMESHLRVLIDKSEGVTLGDCTKASKQIHLQLGIHAEDFGECSVEVSSPGVERPLVKKSHYDKCIGNIIKVKYIADATTETIHATVQDVQEEMLTLVTDKHNTITLSYTDIIKASTTYGGA